MKRIVVAVALIASAGWIWAQFRSAEDVTANVPYDDIAMGAAYQKAIASLEPFDAARRNPPPGADRFAIKVGFVAAPSPPGYRILRPGEKVDGKTEYFWLNDLTDTPNGYEGAISNKADYVTALQPRQRVAFPRENVADWMYFQNGKIVGNATACPALAHASADERRRMRETYGLNCD